MLFILFVSICTPTKHTFIVIKHYLLSTASRFLILSKRKQRSFVPYFPNSGSTKLTVITPAHK